MRFASCLAVLALAAPAALHAADPVAVAAVAVGKPKLGIQLEESVFDPSQGIPVRSVAPGGTAAVLGLLPGDAIKSVNNKAIGSYPELIAAVGGLKAGEAIALDVMRQGQPLTLAGKMLAPTSPGTIAKDLNETRAEIDQLRREVDVRTREPSLAELIRELQFLQEQFPKAAAEFKKIYPNGEFSIVISITSDTTAASPVDLLNPTVPPDALPDGIPVAPQPAH